MASPQLRMQVLRGEAAVCRLGAQEPVPAWARPGVLLSVTRTAEELSVVCEARCVPPGVRAEAGWRVLRIAGPLDFDTVGVLAAIAGPLAAADISLFAISTFDTDYILVRAAALPAAAAALRAAGHSVVDRPEAGDPL
jgi:hypothetical protein